MISRSLSIDTRGERSRLQGFQVQDIPAFSAAAVRVTDPSSVDNLHRTAAVETWTPKLGGICTLKHFDDWLLAISCLTDDDVLLLADGEAFHSMFPE